MEKAEIIKNSNGTFEVTLGSEKYKIYTETFSSFLDAVTCIGNEWDEQFLAKI